MSQQQTVRITTTETTNSSALIINSGYLKTPPGLLKVAQFVNIILFFFLYISIRFIYEKLKLKKNPRREIDFRVCLRRNNCVSFQ